MVTRRDLSSITKKTRYRLSPASVNTSTVNRSQAARPSQCACRNVFQGMCRLRSGAGSTPWSWQDPRHRGPGDSVAEVRERAADPRVAPPRIVDRHPDHELGDVLSGHWSTSTSAGAAIVFLGDQSPVPTQDRIRGDDARDLRQDPPAEFVTAHSESTTLGVRQAKRPRAQVFSEDPILLPEIVDQIVLVTVHPASEREDEELQRRRHSLRLLGKLDQHRPSLGRFFAPYGIGHGGTTPPGTVRVSGAGLGYNTELDFVFPTGLGVFKAGGGLSFHHGSVSLQEVVIPVVSLRIPGRGIRAPAEEIAQLFGVPEKITNRIFGVRIFLAGDLFRTEPEAVRVVLISGNEQVGRAGMAIGGDLDRASGILQVNPNSEASVGMMLTRDDCDSVRVVVLDPVTDAVLDQSDELPVKLGI